MVSLEKKIIWLAVLKLVSSAYAESLYLRAIQLLPIKVNLNDDCDLTVIEMLSFSTRFFFSYMSCACDVFWLNRSANGKKFLWSISVSYLLSVRMFYCVFLFLSIPRVERSLFMPCRSTGLQMLSGFSTMQCFCVLLKWLPNWKCIQRIKFNVSLVQISVLYPAPVKINSCEVRSLGNMNIVVTCIWI